MVVDEYALFQFYDQRLPEDVFDRASLRVWLKASPDHRKAIRMRVEDLLPENDVAPAPTPSPMKCR